MPWRDTGSRLSFPLADYKLPLEHHLELGIGISCMVIVAICLSCYFSITK